MDHYITQGGRGIPSKLWGRQCDVREANMTRPEVSPPPRVKLSEIFLFKSTPSSTSIKVKSAGKRGLRPFLISGFFETSNDFVKGSLQEGWDMNTASQDQIRDMATTDKQKCCHPKLNKNSFPREIRGYLLGIMLANAGHQVFLYGGWGATKQVTESGAFLAF